MASGNGNNTKIQNITKAVNKYSEELLTSIEHKSFTEENIKNMLLTNASILVLLREILSQSGMVSKFANKNELNGLTEKIKEVQTVLNEKLNTEIYKKHIHKFKGVPDGTNASTNKPNNS
jgi:flagellar motor switch protein FliG